MKLKNLLMPVIMALVSSNAPAQIFTFTGKVTDNAGKGIGGVVVNNGAQFTKTDDKGKWTLRTDTNTCKFVSISTPAGYVLPKSKSIADKYYARVDMLVKEKCRHDFVLQKRAKSADDFYFIAISDPQIKNDKQLGRWNSETVADLQKTVAGLGSKHEVVTMSLGDIVWDNMQLFEEYIKSMNTLPVTAFQCIGNHDFDLRYQALNNMPAGSPVYGEMVYGKYFGPTDYSFNIGRVHVVTLKNINYMGAKKYVEQITEAQLEWLRKDLSYVPKGSTVILNMHAAGWNSVESEGNVRNAEELKKALEGYRVHVFAGHTHFFQNNIVGNDIYEHNIGAACGAWWNGETNRCGAPNGYMIVDIKGDSVRWEFKPTGVSTDYRMKVYSTGEFLSQPECVVANVWDSDTLTTVEWYEDGVFKGKMERFTDMDETFKRTLKPKSKPTMTAHLYKACPSEGAREVRVVVKNRFGEQSSETVRTERAYEKVIAEGWFPRIIAHRGYWMPQGSVQNSISALRGAASLGVYGCELDVQMTKDGVVIVNHDPSVGSLPIAECTYERLKGTRLANGEPIPLLGRYLDEARKYPAMKLILEIKRQRCDSLETVLTRKVVDMVKAKGMERQTEYISFSTHICDEILRMDSTAHVSYVDGKMTPKEAKEHGYSAIDYSIAVFRKYPQWVDEAHEIGLTVNIWTPDSNADIMNAISLRPDFITTNFPEEIKSMLEEKRGK